MYINPGFSVCPDVENHEVQRLCKKKIAVSEEKRMMPNPPIQPQTEGLNILTALRWRVWGVAGTDKEGEELKRGREIVTEE